MDQQSTDGHYLLTTHGGGINPNYRAGVFRRRVLLVNEPGKVRGELEDCSHGFRVELHHDGIQVTAVSVQVLRIPLTTCAEVERPLAALVGSPLRVSWQEYGTRLPTSTNCTHVHDLSWWALQHALRPDVSRQYDVAVTDEGAEPSECSLRRNGELVHQWFARQGGIVAPADIAGRTLFRGFSVWARRAFEDDAYEAAIMLQRGYFVAQARRHFGTKTADYSALESKPMHGVCYSYSPGAVERAVALDADMDFTDAPELLLQFK